MFIYCLVYRKSLVNVIDIYFVIKEVIILEGGKNNDNEIIRLVL